MGTTANYDISYPDSTSNVQLWTHIQNTAQSTDDAITGVVAALPHVVARGTRGTNSSASTGNEVSVFRFDDIACKVGRVYQITATNMGLAPASDVAAEVPITRWRYTEDGSTPSTSSTELVAYRVGAPSATNAPIFGFTGFYVPASNTTLSLLLTFQRTGGTASITLNAATVMQFVLTDIGADPGATGTAL